MVCDGLSIGLTHRIKGLSSRRRPGSKFAGMRNAKEKLAPGLRRDDSVGIFFHSTKSSTGAAFWLIMPETPRVMAFYVFICWLALLAGCAQIAKAPVAQIDAINLPPPTPREFRAAWVATVANIDWPSKKGLTVEQQKQEIIRIVERAKELKLNALIFQVRPAADALYASALEPWSEYLSGEQGRPPSPLYDPLTMWIEESHKRGIELHAWFNPYRARHTSAKSPPSRSHIANTHPAVVKEYGGYLWMDPGEEFAAQRTLEVIVDVVRRYNIDGVHVDDYFYPYPLPLIANAPAAENAPELDFPDSPAWTRYLFTGGSLGRADWRRQNVNQLIERIYTAVHREKSWVKVGVSPFGLGRPDRRPPGIVGFSQYDKLYADVELWLANGWLDYLAPQLYWPIDQPAQAFGKLMQYWIGQNTASRHVWPGLYTSRIDSSAKSWRPEEIVDEIALLRGRPEIGGHIHFSMITLMENRRGINDQLKPGYASAALIPATPWLSAEKPAVPMIFFTRRGPKFETISVSVWAQPGYRQFAVWMRFGQSWKFFVMRAGAENSGVTSATEFVIGSGEGFGMPDAMTISAVDQFGIESDRATFTEADFARIQ